MRKVVSNLLRESGSIGGTTKASSDVADRRHEGCPTRFIQARHYMNGSAARPRKSPSMRYLTLAAILAGALFSAGCTHLRPIPLDATVSLDGRFSHEAYGRVLDRIVTKNGMTIYETLSWQPAELDRYLSLVAAASPDSAPELFPTEADALAYWINAHNAAAMRIVVERYPFDSVRWMGRPSLSCGIWNGLGGIVPWPGINFFVLHRGTFGGTKRSLRNVKNKVIRERFDDPRVHFALNSASNGSPRLPREPFEGAKLEEQLDRETYFFFHEPRNLLVDPTQRLINLSMIVKWNRGDIERVVSDEAAAAYPTRLRAYVARYASPMAQEALRDSNYRIKFIPYDWGLNEQIVYDCHFSFCGTEKHQPHEEL